MKDKKIGHLIMMIALGVMLYIAPIYASGIEGSTIYTGIKQLLEDAGKALVVLSIPAGIAMTAYCFVRRSAADEMDHKKWSNRISVTIFSTVGAIVSGAIITVISGYFK